MPRDFLGETDAANSAAMKVAQFYSDPKLQALITIALKNNQELSIIAQEVNISQYEIMTRQGEYLPKLNFIAGAGLEKVGSYTSQGVADDKNGVATNLQDYIFGVTASWEVDIWKKLRNATKAATIRYLASIEGRRFATCLLVSEIAESYYELMALDAQLAVLKQNIQVQQDALAMVRLQKEAARVTELPVKRFEAEVLKNQSRVFDVQQQIVENENRINFLVGRFPQHVDRSSDTFNSLVPTVVHEGIPSQLLENRPDIREAELQLAAAQLDVQVAKASFYPSLGIGATLGYQSFDILKMVDTPESFLYRIAADIMAPLLNRKALTANYFAANSRQMQAVLNYERKILNAYTEVANRLRLIENLQQSFALRAQQVDRLTQAIDISTGLFRSARADYMEVLMTRRDALDSQMELIEIKKKQLDAVVSLYQALGGGWR